MEDGDVEGAIDANNESTISNDTSTSRKATISDGPATHAAVDGPSEESLVLTYLRKYGLVDAASELKAILERDAASATSTSADAIDGRTKRKRVAVDGGDEGGNNILPPIYNDIAQDAKEDVGTGPAPTGGSHDGGHEMNGSTNTLAAATGGGFGYDLDAAPTIALWGAGSARPMLHDGGMSDMVLFGRARDATPWDIIDDATKTSEAEITKGHGLGDTRVTEAEANIRDEARRYIEGFTSLVTWILTLPDDPANPIVAPRAAGRPPLYKNKKADGILTEGGDTICAKNGTATNDLTQEQSKMNFDDGDGEKESDDQDGPLHKHHGGLPTLVGHSLAAAEGCDPAASNTPSPQTLTLLLNATATIPSATSFQKNCLHSLPSCKPELLALSFPLLVHTYCELLTCGLEHTSWALLDTYRHIYEASHHTELVDLDKCQSTKRIVELNDDVIVQSVLHSEMRLIKSQIALLAKKLSEVEHIHNELKSKTIKTPEEDKLLQEHTSRSAKYNETLSRSREKLAELSSKNDALTSKLMALPFLRRARALKWNIRISTTSFAALTGFVSSDDKLLPMSALLQSRCHLIVERRDPWPCFPPAMLEDICVNQKDDEAEMKVRWAAPVHPMARAIDAGEDIAASGLIGNRPARSILIRSEVSHYPNLHFEDSSGFQDVESRSSVEFNRALLISGFRRLEALELKQEYEAGLLPSASSAGGGAKRKIHCSDALQPSVLLATICSSNPSNEADVTGGSIDRLNWSDPNVGVTSVSICPPDGKKIAAGCNDSAIRIWSMDQSANGNKRKTPGRDPSCVLSLGEPSILLLGHRNGFPVFDVDWTRNGRTLLSAGGDGTLRLWDTEAVGSFGTMSDVSVQQRNKSFQTVGGPASTSLSTLVIPGAKAESLVDVGGAALSVYRGHAPSTPIWSVSSAPCGYYFASAGSDYTARIWTTDRTAPVRVLSGHVSPSVNCVAWHPNCNYVVTASDDKTCRMFDIQTGRCVRLLSGSTRGLNKVCVSPSGRYAAGSGYDGVIRLWDLGSGRLVNELQAAATSTQASCYKEGMINAMSFSSCGGALAVAGEECSVRIYDVCGAGNLLSSPDYLNVTHGASAMSSFGHRLSGATNTHMNGIAATEGSCLGSKVPVKVFNTNKISICDLKYTKRNLLLALGCV
jgi:WD40 repeat protein